MEPSRTSDSQGFYSNFVGRPTSAQLLPQLGQPIHSAQQALYEYANTLATPFYQTPQFVYVPVPVPVSFPTPVILNPIQYTTLLAAPFQNMPMPHPSFPVYQRPVIQIPTAIRPQANPVINPQASAESTTQNTFNLQEPKTLQAASTKRNRNFGKDVVRPKKKFKNWSCGACETDTTEERRKGPTGKSTLCNLCGTLYTRYKIIGNQNPCNQCYLFPSLKVKHLKYDRLCLKCFEAWVKAKKEPAVSEKNKISFLLN